MMASLVDIAWLTIREAARRRLFLVLILITAASVALSAWGFSQVREAILSSGEAPGGDDRGRRRDG